VPLPIGRRALDVLGVLVERAGEPVLRDEIISAVWARTTVEDANLTVQISTLRRVLNDGGSNTSCFRLFPAAATALSAG
jgi:DNA-binding winged helix-turn-helix (wHTH) protein